MRPEEQGNLAAARPNGDYAAQLEAVLNGAPLGIYLVDADFRIAFVNPAALPVFGDVPGLIGRDFGEVIRILWPADYADEVARRFRRVLDTGQSDSEPARAEARRDRGVTEYYEWRIDRVPLPDGRAGVVCYFRDISQQFLSRRALAQSEERYRTLFSSIDDGFCVLEMRFDGDDRATDYRFLEVNPAFERQTGLKAAAGRWMRELAPAHEEHWFSTYGRVALTGEPVRFINQATALGGRWFDVYAFRLGGPSSRTVGALFRDITQRRRDEEALARHRDHLDALVRERTAELERSSAQLRTAERMASLGTLAAGIGHDLGNLMLPIRERLDALLTSHLAQDQRSDVQAIAKAVQYLGRIVQGLRLLAQDPERTASGAPLELGDWWQDAAAMLRSALPREVSLHSRMPPEPLRVHIGRAELTQAVFNLVQNAGGALAGQPGGHVIVWARAEPCGTRVRLSVEDNGSGMSEEVRRRCTEPFFTTKTRGMSTGLGLSLVQGIAARAGAVLEVSSELGTGSTFTLVLPGAARGAHHDAVDAFVLVADPRRAAFVAAVLGASGLRVTGVEAVPPPQAESLLVIDGAAGGPDCVVPFAQSGGWVLVLDATGELPEHPRITTLAGRASVGALREALQAAAGACRTGVLSPHPAPGPLPAPSGHAAAPAQRP